MADWFVAPAPTGNDANPGTLGSPKETIPAVLNLWALGDTLYLRAGVYLCPANLNNGKILGRRIIGYNGEDVTLAAGGASSLFTGALDQNVLTSGTIFLVLRNLKISGYNGVCITFSGSHSLTNPLFEMFNVTQRGASTVAATGVYLQGLFSTLINFHHCTWVDNYRGIAISSLPNNVTHCIFDGNTFHVENSLNENVDGFFTVDTKDYNAYPGMTTEANGINTNTTPVGFNNRPALDFSLSPTSALRGAGQFGANIGASFNPRLYIDDNIFDLWNLLANGENDEDYYDTGLGQPGPEGPADAGPVVFDGTDWKIDNVAEPGARSGQVHFGPFTFPAGAKATMLSRLAEINEALSSGLKEVIGAAKTNRKLKLSINAGPKNPYAINENINTNLATADLYLTLRTDGETVV